MTPEENTMHRPTALFLQNMGVPESMIGANPRFSHLIDVQSLPVAKHTPVNFFNQATSSRTLHVQGYAGCSLQEVGRIDANSLFFPLYIGISPVGDYAVDVNALTDSRKCFEFGQITELKMNEKQVGRELPFRECATNRGSGAAFAHGGSTTALGIGMVWGDPQNPNKHGWRIPTFSPLFQAWMGNTTISMLLEQKSIADLNDTFMLELDIFGIESDQ